METTMVSHALNYLKLGWSVIPLEPEGKKPLVKWEKYQSERASPEQIRKWWTKYPKANIGVVTGLLSGIIVIDIDSSQGQENYIAKFSQLHNTISQKTGKPNASQRLFAHPQDRKYHNMARLLDDVDIRADGGYIVVPPSIHPNGTVYKWIIDPVEMGLDDLLPLPDEIKNQLFAQTGQRPKNIEGWVQEALMGVDEGRRTDTCAKLAGYYLRAFEGDTEQVEIILQTWNERNRPPLDWKAVNMVIHSIVKREGRDQMGDGVGGRIERIQIIKYPPPDGTRRYKIFLSGHDESVEMSSNELVYFSRFKIKFTELANRVPKAITQTRWENMLNKALEEAEIIEVTLDETLAGLVLRMINSDIMGEGVANDLKHLGNRIVVNDGTIHLRMEVLLNMVGTEREKIGRKDTGKILRSLGFEYKVIRVGKETRKCWMRKKDLDWERRYGEI